MSVTRSDLPIEVYAGNGMVVAMDHLSQPFWEAAKAGRLSVPHCGACGRHRLPPLPFCRHCQSGDMRWRDVAPRAELYSYTVCQTKDRPERPAFIYLPVVVELPDAGRVRLTGNLVGLVLADVRIGMPLSVHWHPVADGWKVPIFRPAAA
jgi:uncharacterized OB-fold protein